MNRRQFVIGAAAGAAMFARMPRAFAQTYELIIKGGRVIDPSIGLDAIRDVAIAGGRIVAVEPNIAASAPDTIDARGKIVAPGLIDIHTPCRPRPKRGRRCALQDGVTGWVDAGSAGADTIDQVAAVARGAPQIGRAPGQHLAHAASAPAANCTTSTSPTLIWRAAPSPAIATSSSASRRACRQTSPVPTISRRCGARRRRPRPSICR